MGSTEQQLALSLSQHLSVWEMRSDSWISLSDDLGRLVDLARDAPEFVDRHARITATLTRLTPIESFWAFPGRRLFDEVIAWFRAGDLARMHLAVKRINRMLSNNSYRHTELSLDVDTEMPSVIDTEQELNAQIARPYFEVLIVDDMGKEEEEALHRRVESKRRPDDNFIFKCVIVPSVGERYRTPFLAALKDYSKQPTGGLHALPIARGKSILNSNWIQDMLQFYGLNLFMAETSATSGGLDSLLDPVGPLKVAQEYAARAFGARRAYFATNGTSTCNKIVVQAMVQPGD